MPISVTCTCGKRLNVKDEWAGKRGKCPTCGATFQIPATGAAPASAAASWAPKSKPTQPAKEPVIHLSPGIIALIVAAIVIPTVIFLVRIGPVKAGHDWERISKQADDDIRDVVNRGMQGWLSANTSYNPRDPRHTPIAQSPTFLTTAWMMSLPDSVGFAGDTSEGSYHGQYKTRSGEIAADLSCRGQTLHITGHVQEGQIEAFVNGEPARLIEKPLDIEK